MKLIPCFVSICMETNEQMDFFLFLLPFFLCIWKEGAPNFWVKLLKGLNICSIVILCVSQTQMWITFVTWQYKIKPCSYDKMSALINAYYKLSVYFSVDTLYLTSKLFMSDAPILQS